MSLKVKKFSAKDRLKSLINNYREWTSHEDEYVRFILKESNKPDIWLMLISNMPGEFSGGEYIVEIKATSKYPFEPPEFYFYTPNGVYLEEKKVCINIGSYHKDDFPTSLGMGGFAKQLVSGMFGWRTLGGGINIVKTSEKKKQTIAAVSKAYNARHFPELVKRFDEHKFNLLNAALGLLQLDNEKLLKCCKSWLRLY